MDLYHKILIAKFAANVASNFVDSVIFQWFTMMWV